MNKFRTLAILIFAGILVYTGLWYTSAFQAKKDVAATLSLWRDKGIRVENGKLSLTGFPYRVMVTIGGIDIGTRAGGLTVKADELVLISHLWTPGHWMAEARGLEVSAGGGAFEARDGYARASYVSKDGAPPVIVVDSYTTEDFTLLKAPGLAAPMSLDTWQLFLRPGIDHGIPENGLYEDRFLDFKLVAKSTIARLDFEGGISGLPLRDWTPEQLAAWRDSGGLLELEKIDLAAPNTRLKGNASLTLDEDLRPLGSASLSVAGGPALSTYLEGFGLHVAGTLPRSDGAAPVAIMLQEGQMNIGGIDIVPLKPLIGD